MYKIGVIGDKDSVLEFKAIGMSVFPVTNPAEARQTLDRLSEDQYAVIYVTEQVAREIKDDIDKYNSRRFPAIILIPGNQGTLGIGMDAVRKSVERAVGADILFKGE